MYVCMYVSVSLHAAFKEARILSRKLEDDVQVCREIAEGRPASASTRTSYSAFNHREDVHF